MPWLPKLKTFLDTVFHIEIKINSPNITIYNEPGGDSIRLDQNGKRLSINISDLNKENKKQISDILKDYYEEEGELLSENLTNYSNALKKYEQSNPNSELLEFFSGKIPDLDLENLNISLFMRSRFREKANIDKLKEDILKKFGERGSNISNLCTAGYFEDFIEPLYLAIEEEFKDEKEAKKLFLNIYEMIVKNGLLAVFVHKKMSLEELSFEIKKKIFESKKYGFYNISKYLYVHAIGNQNVTTVLQWLQQNDKLKTNIVHKEIGIIVISILVSKEIDVL